MLRLNFYFKSIGGLAVLLVLFSGCGGGDGFKGERGTVSGEVTVAGEPVPDGCQVVFVGIDASYTATGETGANGAYSLNCNGSTKLPAIKYRVQISPPPADAGAAVSTDPMDIMAMPVPNQKPAKTTVREGPFPSMYTSTTTSKLVFEVKAGRNSADFDLVPIKAK